MPYRSALAAVARDTVTKPITYRHFTAIRSRGALASGEIGVISVLRSEAARLPLFFDHYKKLGVHRCFMVDNNSADGSREILALASGACKAMNRQLARMADITSSMRRRGGTARSQEPVAPPGDGAIGWDK